MKNVLIKLEEVELYGCEVYISPKEEIRHADELEALADGITSFLKNSLRPILVDHPLPKINKNT